MKKLEKLGRLYNSFTNKFIVPLLVAKLHETTKNGKRQCVKTPKNEYCKICGLPGKLNYEKI